MSTGLDALNINILKGFAGCIAPILSTILRILYETGCITPNWEKASTGAIYKEGATWCGKLPPY